MIAELGNPCCSPANQAYAQMSSLFGSHLSFVGSMEFLVKLIFSAVTHDFLTSRKLFQRLIDSMLSLCKYDSILSLWRWPMRPLFFILLSAGILSGSVLTTATKAADIAQKQETPTMNQVKIIGPQGMLSTISSRNLGRPQVLFIHADPGQASQWAPVIKTLGSDTDMVAFDARGAGSSDAARNDDYSYEARATDVEAVAKNAGFDRFFLVAHSAGSAVALRYAADHADQVRGVYLLDPLLNPASLPPDVRDGMIATLEGPKAEEFWTGYVASIAGDNKAIVDKVVSSAKRITPDARIGYTKAMLSWDAKAALNAYNGPMFILSTPTTDNPGALYRVRTDIPHNVASSLGHWLQLDQPDMVAHSIHNFLDANKGAK
jgi:pimeloyl-ACP methyl ester carboxylesterase